MQLIIALALTLVASTAHAVDRTDIIKEYLTRNAIVDGTYQPDKAGEVMSEFSALTPAEQDAAISGFVDQIVAEIDADVVQLNNEEIRLLNVREQLLAFKGTL